MTILLARQLVDQQSGRSFVQSVLTQACSTVCQSRLWTIDDRTVLDPMTGTGGFAMEAVTMGRNCLAIDMDPVMVSGTQQNVSWASRNIPSEADFQIICGDATKLGNNSQGIGTATYQV